MWRPRSTKSPVISRSTDHSFGGELVRLNGVVTTINTVGYLHSREDILDAAIAAALETGVHQLTFGKLATRLGIADRTVVYYFPTKEKLITEVLDTLARRMMTVIAKAFGDEPLAPTELGRRAWAAFTTAEADRVFRVFFEVVGLAAARLSPYAAIAPVLIDGWTAWLEPRVHTDSNGRAETLALMAKLDGLLLLRHTVGRKPADAAARAMGFR